MATLWMVDLEMIHLLTVCYVGVAHLLKKTRAQRYFSAIFCVVTSLAWISFCIIYHGQNLAIAEAGYTGSRTAP